MKTLKIAGGIIAALAILFTVFAVLKPPQSTLQASVSAEFVERGGSHYSESYFNFGAFNMLRAGNTKAVEKEDYIGFAGKVFTVPQTGLPKSIANMLTWLPSLINGSKITIALTVTSVVAGIFGAIFLALGKISKLKPLNAVCSAYIFFFRGTPLLMQLYFIYYALPLINPALTINDKFLAAFVAFGLNSAAYCAEIIRAAIQSIDKGQFEASRALGMSYGQAMRLVILPQSVRRLIPPIANEFIMVLKDASLVSLIALSDLTHTTRSISSSTNSPLVFIPAMIIYLIITWVFTMIFNKLEKRFSLYE
jgi:polar amino acid transport system permease protein